MGACWRCGKPEYEKLAALGARLNADRVARGEPPVPTRPVCAPCAWELTSSALEDDDDPALAAEEVAEG